MLDYNNANSPIRSMWRELVIKISMFSNNGERADEVSAQISPGLLSSRHRNLGVSWAHRISRASRDFRRHFMIMEPWTHPFGTTHHEAMEYFLSQGKRVHSFRYAVKCSDFPQDRREGLANEIHQVLMKAGLAPLGIYQNYKGEGSYVTGYVNYRWGSSYISFDNPTDERFTIDVVGTDPNQLRQFQVLLEPYGEPRNKQQKRVHVLQVGPGGDIKLDALGNELMAEFYPENYSSDTVDQYHHLLDCLSSPTPCGRLTIIDGPPGTGKSHLIRSLISDTDAICAIVPSKILAQLSGPNLVSVLVKENQKGKALVLIIEDADEALVNRHRGSIAVLSELLNLSDGILGQLLDIKIVATTNAGLVDLDKAVLRAGRLCTHISTGSLPPEQANLVYKRLVGGSMPNLPDTTLASIYRAARMEDRPEKAAKSSPGQYI